MVNAIVSILLLMGRSYTYPITPHSDTIMKSPVLASTRQLLYKGANFGMILDVRSMIMYLLRTNCNIKRKFQTK